MRSKSQRFAVMALGMTPPSPRHPERAPASQLTTRVSSLSTPHSPCQPHEIWAARSTSGMVAVQELELDGVEAEDAREDDAATMAVAFSDLGLARDGPGPKRSSGSHARHCLRHRDVIQR